MGYNGTEKSAVEDLMVQLDSTHGPKLFAKRPRSISPHTKTRKRPFKQRERELNVQATNCHHRVSRVIRPIVADGGIIGL